VEGKPEKRMAESSRGMVVPKKKSPSDRTPQEIGESHLPAKRKKRPKKGFTKEKVMERREKERRTRIKSLHHQVCRECPQTKTVRNKNENRGRAGELGRKSEALGAKGVEEDSSEVPVS